MNILVCIKQVPETNKVEVDPETGVLKRGGVAGKMNPYDLYALETALRLHAEHNGGDDEKKGRLAVLSMGPLQARQVVREAFSMGAEEGYLLSDRRFGGADVLATSYTLAQGVRKLGRFDLILCGKQTTDGDTAQVGPEISEYLGIPSAANVTRLMEVTDSWVAVEMDLGQAVQLARIPFPCLLSVDKDIYQPRLPSYVRKMRTKDTPIAVLTLDDMEDPDERHYGLNGSPTQVQRIFPPEANDRRELWTGGGEALADRLFDKFQELKLLQ
jgi:electron transfer flavoprotein beta subunit